MEKYRNLNGTSEIEGYLIKSNSITVKYKGKSRLYTYSYHKAGQHRVEKMKALAKKGSGLHSYLNAHAKFAFD